MAEATERRGATSAALSDLRPDARCAKGLNWSCELSGDVEVEELERLLEDLGFRVRCQHPALRVMRHGAGHEIAWVTTTGKVQIRTDLAVPSEDREQVARRIHGDLATCVRDLNGT
jgi:hypothetical protein